MKETLARLRYAPETAVVDIALGIVALVRESILAAHVGLLDDRPPASRERRLALAVLRAADRLARDGHRYLEYTRELASPPVDMSDPRQVEMF
jgi:hypothetical protein